MTPEQAPKREQTPAQRAASFANMEKARATRAANAEARKRGELPASAGGSSRTRKKRKPASTAKPRAIPGERPPARPSAPVLTAVQRDKVIGGLTLALTVADGTAATLVPNAWVTEDRLSEDETRLLTAAIYAELETYPKVLRSIAEFAVLTSAHTWLAVCVAGIAAPRLARRGVINDQLAAQLATLPYLLAAAAAGTTAGADSVPVAAEPASSGGGPNGYGEIDPNGVAVGYATSVQGDPPVESR